MSTPDRPWQQPTATYPQPKKRSPLRIVLLSILGVLVLCVGSTVTLGLAGVLDDPDQPAVTQPAGDSENIAPLVGATTSRAPTATPKATADSITPPTTRPAPKTTTIKPEPTTKKQSPRPATTKPKPRPTTVKPSPKSTTKAPGKTVTPGAFCSPVGEIGYTSKGTRMRCTLKDGEDRARWRKA
ncbi:hypothetical protein [Actinoplanes sp. NPDC049316]|uniref:hypothetical protein n=1 Tax=Actinoplanes sp. NPDC049316 TaxID=3154727 RepID=UPI00344645EC